MLRWIIVFLIGVITAIASAGACPGDATGNDVVDVDDLLETLNQFGLPGGGSADFDGDGDVDVSDLLILLEHWGADCDDAEYAGCLIFEAVLSNDGCGRPVWDSDPNGYLLTLTDSWLVYGATTVDGCDWYPEAPDRDNEFVTAPYNVSGTKLQEVGDAIFDAANGAGNPVGNRRYAGWVRCQIGHDGTMSWVNGKLIYQITEITFTLTMNIPEWTMPEDVDPTEAKEWMRFMQSLQVHEMGHIKRFKAHYAAIKQKFENQPAGVVSIPNVPSPPTFDDFGNPANAESAALLNQMSNEALKMIGDNPTVQAMIAAQAAYDAPPSKKNPDGTDHGRTQEAMLNY